MRLFLLMLATVIASKVSSQVVQGKITDSTGKGITGAVVSVFSAEGWKLIAYKITDVAGAFRLQMPGDKPGGLLRIRVAHQSYRIDTLQLDSLSQAPLHIVLTPLVKELPELVIKAALPVVVRGDTTIFDAARFAGAEDRKLGDVLKKMPGFRVEQNGRLSYNGKEVEKLLIDGEDPAGELYGLVTGQLDAFLVDKVEVVDNFVDNRLLRGIKNSDKVGVNLRLKSAYKFRLSGSAEWGRSIGSRQEYSINGTVINDKIKWLGFITGNNTGQEVGLQLPESFPSGSAGEVWTRHGFPEDRLFAGGAGQISLPPLGERYVKRNRDLGVISMVSWKQGKFAKMSVQSGLAGTGMEAALEHWSSTNIPDEKSWSTEGIEQQSDRNKRFFSSIHYLRDKGKDRNSGVRFSFGRGAIRQHFLNNLNGDVVDTLREYWQEKAWWYSGEWKQTIKTGASKVLEVLCRADGRIGEQQADVYTLRLYAYFNVDPDVRQFKQEGRRTFFLTETDVRTQRLLREKQLEYGWRTTWLSGNSSNRADGFRLPGMEKLALGNGSIPSGMLTSVFYFTQRSLLFKKVKFEVAGNAGLSRLTGNSMKQVVLPVWKARWSLQRSFGKKNSLGFTYQWNRSFTNVWSQMPDRQLSGNRSIVYGLQPMGTEAQQSAQLLFRYLNLFRQNQWIISLTFAAHDHQYGSSLMLKPAYSVQYFERYPKASSWYLLIQHNRFIPVLKSKWQTDIQWLDRWNMVRINGIPALQQQQLGGMENRLISGFEGRWNGEVAGYISYNVFKRASIGPDPNWQWYTSFKLKWKAGNRLYAAGMWKWQQLSPSMGFPSSDVHILGKMGERFHWRMEWVNLLNLKRVEQRQVSAFEETITSYVLNGRYLLAALSYRF
jgi:hypothetical protein